MGPDVLHFIVSLLQGEPTNKSIPKASCKIKGGARGFWANRVL